LANHKWLVLVLADHRVVVEAADVRTASGSEKANNDPMSSILLPVTRTRIRPNPFCRYPDLLFGSNWVAILTTREKYRYGA
jgi:hypothetical protein